MDLNDFIRHFTGIQCQLDWYALFASRPVLDLVPIRSRDALSCFFTPWRRCTDGSYGDGNTPDAQPLTVMEPRFPEPVEARLSGFVTGDSALRSIPCYSLGGAGYLVLDGNHRLVSLYRSGQTVQFDAWVISGPVSGAILPDLAWWEG